MTSNDLYWPPLTSTNRKYFNYGLMHIKQKLGTQGIHLQQQIQCLNLMTSYDLLWPKWLPKMKMF